MGGGSVVVDVPGEIFNGLHLWEHEHLGVGSPKDHNFVNSLLHVLDVLSDLVNALSVGTLKDVVNSVRLIGGDELWVQDGWQRLDLLQVILKGVDEVWLKNMGPLACGEEISLVDVPTRDLEVARVDHWHEVLDWLVDILKLVGGWVHLVTNVGGGALSERSMEVWVLDTLLGLPSLTLFVGQNSGCEGRTIVTSEADKHDTKLWDFSFGLDLVDKLVNDLFIGFLVPHWD